ncbi:MAG: deoxyribodipyrimidine photo-lyase, partial [Candidatus Nanohaloarchaea archaeon]
MTAIAWIRRSLREYDNTALVEASKEHDEVIPFYVVDEEYFEEAELGYPRVKFWHDSLKEFSERLEENGKKLVVRKGKPVEKLQELVEETGAEKIYFNRDYSPYSRERDSRVKKEVEAEAESFKDIVMFEKKEILTNSGDPYSVYSYYRDKWFEREKPRPQKAEAYTVPDVSSEEIPSLKALGFEKPEEMEVWEGGRSNGRERLSDFVHRIGEYGEKRDLASEDATSKLSPHLKFGTVSIREAFWEAERAKARGQDEEGVKTWQEELAWRDFYFQMLWNHPETTKEPFLDQYASLEWKGKDEAEELWKAWVEGKTGYP